MPGKIVLRLTNGRETSFKEIAKKCEDPDITHVVVYDRWKKLKRPAVLTSFLIGRMTRPVSPSLFGKDSKIVKFEGKDKTYKELAEMFTVSIATISRKAIKHNFVLTKKDMVFKRNTQRTMLEQAKLVEEAKRLQEEREEKEQSKVGWAERKYFPDTGKNGFFGGKGETNYPVRVVKQ
jgi:hypothetical protein